MLLSCSGLHITGVSACMYFGFPWHAVQWPLCCTPLACTPAPGLSTLDLLVSDGQRVEQAGARQGVQTAASCSGPGEHRRAQRLPAHISW